MCPKAGRAQRSIGRRTSWARKMEKRAKFHGSMPALVTPFKDGKIDEQAFRALIDWQITSGSHGLVPVGTTGESPTLTHEEHRRAVDMCIDEARGRVPVIAGAGSNNTAEAIEFCRHAEQSGADAVLVVTPYYNKPTQEGLYQHFKAVNDAIGNPDHHLQYPPAQRSRHVRRHHEAALRASQHRRRQGRDRRRGPRVAPATRDGPGLYPTFRRRHDGARGDGRRRARLYFGDRECRARTLRRVDGGDRSRATGRMR